MLNKNNIWFFIKKLKKPVITTHIHIWTSRITLQAKFIQRRTFIQSIFFHFAMIAFACLPTVSTLQKLVATAREIPFEAL